MLYSPGQRVTIQTGSNTGRKATVLAPEQAGRVGVLVDGLADGAFRSYLTASVKAEADPSPTPVPAPAPAPSPGSSNLRLVLDEQFTGPLDETRWELPRNWNGGNHSQWSGRRDLSALSIVDNQLVITATYDPVAKIIRTGMVTHRTPWTLGRVEARIRTEHDPTGQMSGVGLRWPVPVNGVQGAPGDGELDWYETTNSTDRKLRAFYHYAGAQNLQEYWPKNIAEAVDATQWHTVTMEVTQTAIRQWLNGELVWTVTHPGVLSTLGRPGRIALQYDCFGRSGYVPLPVLSRMVVDYVRVWTP